MMIRLFTSSKFFYAIIFLFMLSINSFAENITKIQSFVKQIGKDYMPDKSIALWEINVASSKGKYLLLGKTTSAEAKKSLLKLLDSKHISYIDNIKILPDSMSLNGKCYGVVNVSVANIRGKNSFVSGMETQALMGTPVSMLERDGWVHIQTPDNYLGWVHRMAIVAMTKSEIHQWNQSEKVVITVPFAISYSAANIHSQVVSDLVAGDRLRYLGSENGYYKVGYPDGRLGYVEQSNGALLSEWRKNLKLTSVNLISTAKQYMGYPYLWAGMSSKGMDCSGFVRNVLFMYDVIIPRDASQQAMKGKRIEISQQFANLLPGDLLFFGDKAQKGKKERISHVAIYIGHQQAIHSLGDVHISNFNKNDNDFDKYNYDRLLFATRFLPYINKDNQMLTTDKNCFYQW